MTAGRLFAAFSMGIGVGFESGKAVCERAHERIGKAREDNQKQHGRRLERNECKIFLERCHS